MGEGLLVICSHSVLQDLGVGGVHLANLLLQAKLHIIFGLLCVTHSLMFYLQQLAQSDQKRRDCEDHVRTRMSLLCLLLVLFV